MFEEVVADQQSVVQRTTGQAADVIAALDVVLGIGAGTDLRLLELAVLCPKLI